MELLKKQNKSVCFMNIVVALGIILIAAALLLYWLGEKMELDEGASELSVKSELSQYVYIDADYLSDAISTYSEDNKLIYTTHLAFYKDRIIPVSIPTGEFESLSSLIESEEGTKAIRIEGRLVEIDNIDKKSVKDYIEYLLEEEISDLELSEYSYAYTLDMGESPKANIVLLIAGIVIFLLSFIFLIGGFRNLSGCNDQKDIYKDESTRYKFEKELNSNNTVAFKGLIFLNSWLIIKGKLKTSIIKYEDITKYYELTETKKFITSHYVAIETEGNTYKAPYSKSKDGDINKIYEVINGKLNGESDSEE